MRAKTEKGLIIGLILLGGGAGGAGAQPEIVPEPLTPSPEGITAVEPTPTPPDLPPLVEPSTPPETPVPPPEAPGVTSEPPPAPGLPSPAETAPQAEPAAPARSEISPAPSGETAADAAVWPISVPGRGPVALGPVTHTTPAQHQVVAGDDLHLLAAYYYGNARLWRLIFEANRKLISDPNKLPRGMTLLIPAPPL